MITPFGPPSDELDRLNSALDAQVTGKRAPETDPVSDTEMLAATAHFVSLHPETQGETPSTDTLDAIWRNVMHAHAIPDRPSLNGPLPDPAPDDSRIHDVRGPEPPTVASWISLAAVAALLIGIVGAAWGLREGGGGDEPQIRLAATALDETPEAASNDSEWLTWVTPEECTVDPMTTEEYAEIMREEPDISGRSYDVVGPADPETAEAVANAARERQACIYFGSYQQVRSLESPAFIFYKSASIENTRPPEEEYLADIEHSQQISEQAPNKEPSSYAVISKESPPDKYLAGGSRDAPPLGYSPLTHTFDPNNAIQLEDGRVALPVTSLYWEEDPWFAPPMQGEIDTATRLSTLLLILTNETGEWKLDEQLLFCNGVDCDDVWAERMESYEAITATPGATPIATPDD